MWYNTKEIKKIHKRPNAIEIDCYRSPHGLQQRTSPIPHGQLFVMFLFVYSCVFHFDFRVFF